MKRSINNKTSNKGGRPTKKLSEKRKYRITVKMAKLSAYIKCVEELKAGNDEFKKAAQQTMDAMVDMELPELEYFMEHFLPSYRLTLDELE